jgi:hypothetical protein
MHSFTSQVVMVEGYKEDVGSQREANKKNHGKS